MDRESFAPLILMDIEWFSPGGLRLLVGATTEFLAGIEGPNATKIQRKDLV